jgi:peptidoglycan/LPS O-acetylase OafA/YrhL
MVLIGDASYSLYLLQGFVVLMLVKITFLNHPFSRLILAVLTIYGALKMFRVEAVISDYCKNI